MEVIPIIIASIIIFLVISSFFINLRFYYLIFIGVTLFSPIRILNHYFFETCLLMVFTVLLMLRLFTIRRYYISFSTIHLFIVIFCIYMLIHTFIWIKNEVLYRNIKLLFFYMWIIPFSILFPLFFPKEILFSEFYKYIFVFGHSYYLLILLFPLIDKSLIIESRFEFNRLLGLGKAHPAYALSGLPFILVSNLYFLERKKFYLGIIGIIIDSIVMIKSGSRSAFISFCLVLLIYAFRKFRENFFKVIPFFILLFILCTVYASLNCEEMVGYRNRIKTIFILKELKHETRALVCKSAFELFSQSPIFGVGLGQFENKGFSLMLETADELILGYSEKLLKWRSIANSGANSFYLGYLSETGIVGFLLLMCIIFFTTKKLSDIKYEAKNIEAELLFFAWIVYLVIIGVISIRTHMLFWLLVSLACYKSRKI